MSPARRHFFSLHELLLMAALAALGGVSSSAVSVAGRAINAATPWPGGGQFLAGIHVLWLVLAVGLIRKPGSATVTSLLKGAVELLSGNPHGLIVVMYCAFAGIAVDGVWLLLGGRHRLSTYALAGGLGSAANILTLKLVASLPDHQVVLAVLALMATLAFVSGVLLAGVLGWWLFGALRRAGVAGALAPRATARGAAATPAAPEDVESTE